MRLNYLLDIKWKRYYNYNNNETTIVQVVAKNHIKEKAMKFKDDFIEIIKNKKVDYYSLRRNHCSYHINMQWWDIIELEEEDFDKAINVALTFRPIHNENGPIATKYINYKKAYFNGSIDEYSLRTDLNPEYFISFFENKLCKRKQEATRCRIKDEIEKAFADSNLNLLDTYNEIMGAYIEFFKCQRETEELPKRVKKAEERKREAEKMLLSATSAK